MSDLVTRVLAQRHGHANHAQEAIAMKVFGAFAQIGPPLTQHAEPQLFRGGILTLNVRDSAWLTELTFLKPEILERLNGRFPNAKSKVVRDLRMRLGTVRKKKAPEPPPPELTAAQKLRVEDWASGIVVEEVREAVARAAARSLATPRSRQSFIEGPPGPMRSAPVAAKPVAAPEPPKDRWASTRDRWKQKKER